MLENYYMLLVREILKYYFLFSLTKMKPVSHTRNSLIRYISIYYVINYDKIFSSTTFLKSHISTTNG